MTTDQVIDVLVRHWKRESDMVFEEKAKIRNEEKSQGWQSLEEITAENRLTAIVDICGELGIDISYEWQQRQTRGSQ